MSAKLAMRVFESNLPPHLKATAALLAHFANEDGERIYPSVGRVAWLLGKTERRVRADLTALCELGVLVAVTPRQGGGGRGRTTHYELDQTKLPWREPWSSKPGRSRPGIEEENPDAHVRVQDRQPGRLGQKPGRLEHETRTFETQNPDVHVRRSLREGIEDLLEEGGSSPSAYRSSLSEEEQQTHSSQIDRVVTVARSHLVDSRNIEQLHTLTVQDYRVERFDLEVVKAGVLRVWDGSREFLQTYNRAMAHARSRASA